MDRPTEGQRADFGTKLIYSFFLKKKAGISSDLGWGGHGVLLNSKFYINRRKLEVNMTKFTF